MNIYELLSETTILPRLEVADKDELLETMLESFAPLVKKEQLEAIRAAVIDRERVMSTGIGKGLAIPHGKCSGIPSNLAALATLATPIDYDSIDRQPVRLALMLVGPDSNSSVHIKLLSRISRLMISDDFRERLLACETPAQILEEFHKEEAATPSM